MKISGGNKLEKELQKMAAKAVGAGTLRAGFLPNATYPDGKPVAMIAVIQDFGAPAAGIPPRPFFRNAVAAGKRKWGGQLAGILKANGLDAKKALMLMGEVVKGDIQNSIVNGQYTPLAQSTVRRKGHAQPLIDTAHMLNSVDYEVK